MTYHAMETVGAVDEYHMRIARGSDLLTHEEAAKILNEQAETIDVLREWLAAGDINTYRERWIADQKQGHWPAVRIELAKRRIAALEGK